MEFTSTWHMAVPAVISETIDGETIIVNLDSGAYYSLRGVGAEIWGFLQEGMSLGTVISSITGRYAGAPQHIAAAVTALIEELISEQLLTPGAAPAAEPALAMAQPPADRPPFVKPVLEKYTDMADLLLLDPIHEVDEQGWPHPTLPR